MKTCVVLALFLMAGVSLGDIQKRVNNGRPCTADETKSFVFITECAGTVIGNGNWIITAKHCEDDGGLDRLIRWFSPTKIKDVTLTQTITLEKTFKHATADIMLIKVNTSMEGMPLVSEADCSQVLNQISPTNPVPMVVPARHTKEEDKTWKDVSMCADINVNGRGTIRKTNVLLWSPGACDTCKGDSGAGYIYNNALFAVHSGKIPVGQGKVENVGPIVCNGHIRNWIVNTMNNNP